MKSFGYKMPETLDDAFRGRALSSNTTYIAGGTNLIDHLKLGVEQTDCVVDVKKLGFDKIEDLPAGGLRIGATVRNTALAYDHRVQKRYPVLSEAILSGASPQLRNVATTAGNLLQRTRCYYFRDGISPCNKRVPGSGCAAINGLNRIHAILGTSSQCIATHPSDMDVALVALDALILIKGSKGERSVPISEFYIPYSENPAKENILDAGDLITAVELPATSWFAHSYYFKARERASYEFALSSAAVAVDLDGQTIRDCRIALGGVATKPWRAHAAEARLRGHEATEAVFQEAAKAELKSAVTYSHNAFKVDLCRISLVNALHHVSNIA